jgi:hypothetical protein
LLFLAVCVIPALNFGAIFLMFLEVTKLDSFTALGVGTLYVKIKVEP